MDIISMNQDTVSFHQLYNQYSKDVYRFSYWLTGDADEAQDITSETFVRVWTSTRGICKGISLYYSPKFVPAKQKKKEEVFPA
jgi:DNA-directed RNA polymerase specialized sigma24 family protein